MKKIIFIGGCSRSGTTLVEMHYSNILNISGFGELRHLASRGYSADDKCSCGDFFSECIFWRNKFKEKNFEWHRFEKLSLYFNSPRGYFFYLFPIFRSKSWCTDFKYYISALREIYIDLSQDSDIFFDSSKNPIYYLYLKDALEDFDMYYLDVIRSPFGVVNSWSSVKIREEAKSRDKMKRYNIILASFLWNIYVIFSSIISGKQEKQGKVVYESFCKEPSKIPETLKKFIGESSSHQGYHGVSGNPSRLNFEIKRNYKVDTGYKKNNILWKLTVTLLALPGLILKKILYKQ